MWLINPSGRIAAFNDDFVGLDSDIVFQAPASGNFRLIIHAFATPSAGFTTVLHSVNGGPPGILATNAKFAGTKILTDWNSGIRFETAGTSQADPVLLLFEGTSNNSALTFSDDLVGARGVAQTALDSRIFPTAPSNGLLTDDASSFAILGAFSQFTEGEKVLCQSFRSWMSPLMSPPRDVAKPAPRIDTPEMHKYELEYLRLKPKFVEMKPDERDAAILKLQRDTLPESQIRTLSAPPSFATAAFVAAQNAYLENVKRQEKELIAMNPSERSKALTKMKAETMGRALLKVEPDYGIPLEVTENAGEAAK
jgi:hypothetical protein